MTRFLTDLKLFAGMIRDILSGKYRKKPARTFFAIFAGLAYVIMPADLIPDIIPFLGQIDDIGVLGFCWYLIQKDLAPYRDWRNQQPREVEFSEE